MLNHPDLKYFVAFVALSQQILCALNSLFSHLKFQNKFSHTYISYMYMIWRNWMIFKRISFAKFFISQKFLFSFFSLFPRFATRSNEMKLEKYLKNLYQNLCFRPLITNRKIILCFNFSTSNQIYHVCFSFIQWIFSQKWIR